MYSRRPYRRRFVWRNRTCIPLNDNRVRRPANPFIVNTKAVFTDTSGLEKTEFLLIGDSIIKNVTKIANTQIIAFRGLNLQQMSGIFHTNQIPYLHNKALIVAHIGTNNIQRDSHDLLMKKTETLINCIRASAPQAKIALSLVIPRPVDFTITNVKVKTYIEAVRPTELCNTTEAQSYIFITQLIIYIPTNLGMKLLDYFCPEKSIEYELP